MSGNWEIKTIGEIALVKGGKRVPKGYKLVAGPTSYPYITVSNFRDDGTIDKTNLKYIEKNVYEQIKRYTISSDDLYVSIAGTIGKTGSVPEGLNGANLTENACKLVFQDEVDKQFIYYFTKSNSFVEQANINTRVAAQPKLALKRLKTISIPLPPLPEQKRIVAILDEAFESITQAVVNAEKNLVNARELFESYLNGVITQKGEEWPVVILADVCTKIQDGAHKSPQVLYPEPGSNRFPYLTSKNIRTGYLKLDTVQYCDASFHKEIYSRCNPELEDVLLTKDGANTGNVTINTLEEPFSLLSSVCLLKPDQKRLSPHFLAYYIQSKEGFEQITGQMTGAAIKRIILKTIKSSLLPLPPLTEQKRIVKKLNILGGETQHLENIYQKKLTALDELKQSILQKAFSGSLTGGR